MSGSTSFDIYGQPTQARSSMSGVPFMLPVSLGGSASGIAFPAVVSASFAGSVAATTTAPGAAISYSLTLSRAGVGNVAVCIVTFAAGSTTGTFSAPNPYLLLPANAAQPGAAGALLIVPGDVASLQGAGSNDATFEGATVLLSAHGL